MDQIKSENAVKLISVTPISDLGRLLEFEGLWNRVINDFSTNPFLLSGFLLQFMQFRSSQGWRPLLLLLTRNGTGVGAVPLMMRTRFGIRFIRFLAEPFYSPDFVLDPLHLVPCVDRIIDFLFRDLGTVFLNLAIPSESPNLSVLRVCCDKTAVCFRSKPLPLPHARSSWGHRILQIHGSWNAYRFSQGHDFRYNIKRIERDLGRAGSWRIIHVDGLGRESDIAQRIYDIERRSWKENWRRETGRTDVDLRMMLRGAKCTSEPESGFRWYTSFLELDGKAVAYALIVEYKRVTYLAKTSFDERYRRLNIGAYVINEVIHELFDRGQADSFDLMTDLPFMGRWTSMRLSKTRVMMCRKGIPSIIGFLILHASDGFMRMWRLMRTSF